MSLIRDGEVSERVAEWEAARVAERRLIAEKLAELHPADLETSSPPLANGGGSRGGDPETPCVSLGDSVTSESPRLHHVSSYAGMSNQPNALNSLSSGSMSTTARSSSKSDQQRLEALEKQVSRLRVGVANVTDENRFLRLEVDVLREALLGRQDPEAAMQALQLIGRRAGTQEKRDSVCTYCLQRAPCFRCYACRSVEYCSSQCQLKSFPTHLAFCRHVTERS